MDEIFARLYDTHQERLRSYLRSLGVSSEEVDDLLQDAFLRLYHRIYQPASPIEREKLVAYLYTIARNLAIDQYRQKKRANRIEIDFDGSILQSIPDPSPVPEDVYEEKELQEDRAKAIEKLPQKLAEAVKGLLDGKALKIIAQEIGIQVPALKYRLRRARDLLNTTQTEDRMC